jgi:hypothetical protein
MDTGKKFAKALVVFLLFVGHCFAQPNQAPDFTPPASFESAGNTGEKSINYSEVKNIYQLVFLYNEILDERELRYVFSQHKEFLSDFNMVIRRAKDLENAPHLWECVILPDRSLANELLMFNRAYRKYLEDCSSVWFDVYSKNWLLATKEENEALYQIWDCVRDARCVYYYVHIRRQALKRLVDTVGPLDNNFKLPPHVPIWRFTQIR